ncbi:hypothetical protein [Methanobrevibacter oralis]|uniref:hypothetical protein n=1 Tax=Methanobrevibacter oralis TaxID=66851 RepID=UPI003CC8C700
MKYKLNLDIKDLNYTLLKEIFKIMNSRKTSKILASFSFKNLIIMFFDLDISIILNKFESNRKA